MIANFRKHLSNIATQKRVKIETAFVHWYVDTRFGKNSDKNITDGPNDGGIDAVIFVGDENVFVIQSEFCNKFFNSENIPPLSPKKYSQFDGLPDIFRNDVDFKHFLKTVDSSLHGIYQKVADLFQKNPSNVVWEITTLHTRSLAGERRLRNIDVSNIRYGSDNFRLYELSLEGATPPASPLEINFIEHFIVDDTENNIKSYVAQAYLKDFIEYIEHDPQFRVLARNVRSELKDKIAKEIKNELKDTYEKHPSEFWYSHNGITIICDRASIKGKKINLISPYIINGAQTIHALKGSRKRDPKAKILIRVIEIPSEDQKTKNFINSIIFRTNQQNRMYTYDLRANDAIQVKLANDFLSHRVFYERRRGDWDLNKRVWKNQGISRIKSTELAQILMSCNQQLGGVSLAKKSKEELFSEKYYNDIL
ncbi:MAG: AIPR family protein [Candidatus Bilamarchaeaceae archaeon]